MDDAAALKMHFKGRVAAIACEKRQLAEHIKLLQNEHLQHMAERSIPEDVTAEKFHRQIGDLQMPHAGAAHHGRCQCTGEIRLGGQCMQALYLAEADTHARLARLQSAGGGKRMIEDADWAVALNHAVSLGPGGRLGKRLKDRLEMLTIAGAAQQRDHQMASAGLRVPPRVVRSMAEAEAPISHRDECEEDAQSVVSSKRSSRAGGSVLGTMPSARTAGVGGSMAKTAKQRLRWPGATSAPDFKPSTSIGQNSKLDPQMILTEEQQQRLEEEEAGASTFDQIHMHEGGDMGKRLETLVPSIIGDESFGHAATMREKVHVDKPMAGELSVALKDKGDDVLEFYMHEAGELSVALKDKGDDVLEFYMHEAGELSVALKDKGDDVLEFYMHEVGVLSVANKDKGDDVLEDKTMEALYFMRFIKTKRSKLKVLHYMNAIVSMQLTLLGDEELERDAVDSLSHTTSAKEFTCPMQYAASIRTKDDHRNAKDTPSVPSQDDHRNAKDAPNVPSQRPSGGVKWDVDDDEADADASPPPPPPPPSLYVSYCPQRPSGGVKWDVDDNEADAVAEAAAASVELPDVWCDDQEAGVAVRQKEGKWVLYRQSIDMFRNLEEELLRVGTHYLEQYCGQLHMVGKEEEEQEIDRATILEDLWSFESQFCEAKHKLMVAYLQAYRHAEADSPLDEWTADRPTPFNADGNAKWSQLNSNTPQPHHLSARVQLRREMLDLCFRRPQFALEDGYFAGRYINATVCLDMEANLVAQLSSAVAKQERQALTNMFMSAARAHAAEEHGEVVSVVYGGVLATTIHRGLMQEGGFLPSVGAAVAQEGGFLPSVGAAVSQIPAILRKLVSDFAEVHQICHFVELSELRRVIVQHACVEMNLLQSEEAYRQLAVPDKPPPKDSKIKDSLGRGNDDAVAIAQANWLCTSLVADNLAVPPPKDSKIKDSLGRGNDDAVAIAQANWLCTSLVPPPKDSKIKDSLGRGNDDAVAIAQANCLCTSLVPPPKDSKIKDSLGRGNDDAVAIAQANWLCTSLTPPKDSKIKDSLGRGNDDAVAIAQANWLCTSLVPPPKDSKIKDSLGRGNDDAVAIAQANWLCTSLVADNPAVVAMAAVEAGASPKNALEAVLLREDIIRRLYRTEVLWIVYCCQSRALGKNVKHAEMAAIDWDGLDQQGNPTKPELKKEVVVDCIMMAVGRSGLIGGVWRVPPLALSEFTTSPSELLQPHSLTALKALMSQDSLQMKTLRAASQAQSLREIAFHTSTTHNQILLDFVIRKLDRRRRVLMWRTAAMEGDTDESTMDVCIGGPPGQYAPSAYEPTNNIYHSVVPPLLKEPAKARMQTYQQKRRHSRTQGTKGGKSRSRASSFSSSMDGGEEQIELLDARSQGDFKESRKMLTEAVSPLWLDVHDIKLSLRKQARQNFVENLRIALRAPGGSQGGAGHGTASGANQGGAGHGTAGGANSAGAVTNRDIETSRLTSRAT
eukprot:gene18323-24785_t